MYCKYYIQFNWDIFICDILFPAGAPIVFPASRGVKYLSNFTWLLYLSIILGDFYFIQVQFKLTTCTCTFTWLHFWRKKQYCLLLTFLFQLKKRIIFLFYLMHIKYDK